MNELFFCQLENCFYRNTSIKKLVSILESHFFPVLIGTKLAPQYMAVATAIVVIQRRGPHMSTVQFTKTAKQPAEWTQMT